MAQRISEQVVEWLTIGGKAFTPQTTIPLVINKVGDSLPATSSFPSGTGGNITLYNRKGQIWTLGEQNASNSLLSSQMIISSDNSGAGGPVGIELWRGSNASWQIVNDVIGGENTETNSGYLTFKHNWTGSKQTTYAIKSVTMSSGALDQQFVQIHSTSDAADQQLSESGALRVMGSIGAQNNIRTKNNFYSDMTNKGYYLKDAKNKSFAGMLNGVDDDTNNSDGDFWIGAGTSTGRHHTGNDGRTYISSGFSTKLKKANPSLYMSNPTNTEEDATGTWSHEAYNVVSYRDSGNLTYYVDSSTTADAIAKVGSTPNTDLDAYKIPDEVDSNEARGARQTKGGTIYLKLATKSTAATNNNSKLSLNIDSAGAKNIFYNGKELIPELTLAGYHTLTYDGTQYQEVNPSAIGVLPGYSNGTRLASMNIDTSPDNLIGHAFYFVASSTANSSHTKPGSLGTQDGSDAQILQMNWDTNKGWSTQLGIVHGASRLFIRSQTNLDWNGWREAPLFEENTASATNRIIRSIDAYGSIRSATNLYADDSSIGINAETTTATPTNGAASTAFKLYVDGKTLLTEALYLNNNLIGSGSLIVHHSSVTKGTAPSATQYRELIFREKVAAAVGATANNLGIFGNEVTTGNHNQVYLRNYMPTASSTTHYDVVTDVASDGTRYLSSDFLIRPGTNDAYDLGTTSYYWRTLYVKNQYLDGQTANKLMWTDANKKVTAANHYADSTHVAINSASLPSYNFYISGTQGITGVLTSTNTTAISAGNNTGRTGAIVTAGGIHLDGGLKVGKWTNTSTAPGVGIRIHDLRDITDNANKFGDYAVNWYFDQINGNWASIMSMKGWTGSYYAWELAGNGHNSKIDRYYVRTMLGTTASDWHTLAYLPAFAAIGGVEQPVYVNSDGVVTKTTYALSATVKSGTTPRIAYYSTNREISSGEGVEYASNGLHFTSSGKLITQYLNDTSNYGCIATWQTATPYTETYKPQIGFHNTGESICILPYQTSDSPWGRTVGLSVGKTYTRLHGSAGNLLRLYNDGDESSIYYKSTNYNWTAGINVASFGNDTFAIASGSTLALGINHTSLHFRTNAFTRDTNVSAAATGAFWIRDTTTTEARYLGRLYWYKYASDHASRANWHLVGLTVYDTNGTKELYIGRTKESTARGFISWSDGYVSNSIIPFSNNTYNLGSVSYRWKNAYLYGSLYISNNDAFVNDLNSGNSGAYMAPGRIELSASTPYIDFKYNVAASDYTARIINDQYGAISILGTAGSLTYESRTISPMLRVNGVIYSNSNIEAAGYFLTQGNGYYLFNNNTQQGRFYVGTAGTTDTTGTVYLLIGNSTASGTANNARGYLRIYASADNYAQFTSETAYLRQVLNNDSTYRVIGANHDLWFGIGSGNENRGIYHTGKGWGLYWDSTGSVTLQAETPSTTTAQNVYLWSKVAFRKTYSWGTAANRTALSNVANGTVFFQVL